MALSTQRRTEILDLVRRQGFVATDELVRRFHVTPQTIRRDLNDLAAESLIERFHGGAARPSSVENLAYPQRRVMQQAEKQRIGALVARHVPDRASLFINIGTTTEAVAEALLGHEGLHVVTNNLNVAQRLHAKEDFRVIIAGGIVRPSDAGVVGEATVDLIRQFKVDIGIIGISGIDADGGLLDYDYREVRVAQAIIENSARVFLVADHSKFNRSAMVRLGRIEQAHAFFTDRTPPAGFAARLTAAGVELHVAGGD
jgi:DeoR family glycerol-3-phosphate regulon repressor